MQQEIFNFSAGPATLPMAVKKQIQRDFLNYSNTGCSIIELSHRSEQFDQILQSAKSLLRNLTNLPESHEIMFIHGGARMMFSAIPLNFLHLKPSHMGLYIESGYFSKIAINDAKTVSENGSIQIIASSAEQDYRSLPNVRIDKEYQKASYLFVTSNNTIFGTQWQQIPQIEKLATVVDATSDLLAIDRNYQDFDLCFASLQKNLGPSGLAVVMVKKELLGKAQAHCPPLLNLEIIHAKDSLLNTTNTFAIYTCKLVLEWIESQGGLKVMDRLNRKKSKLIYDIIDSTSFYQGYTDKESRSINNITFSLPTKELEQSFLKQAKEKGLIGLAGHRAIGGIRASLFNAMPLEGAKALEAFMKAFLAMESRSN